MTEEDKQLLLKDICARLPYGVCVHVRYKEGEPCYGKLAPRDIQWFMDSKIEVIKPYLRPISSMPDEEKSELKNLQPRERLAEIVSGVLEFYCKYHLDYNRLIEKNLALEASERMYKID